MIARRTLLGLAIGLVAGPAVALRPRDPATWIAYERRLRGRLADAGGGRFDERLARDLFAATNAIPRPSAASCFSIARPSRRR